MLAFCAITLEQNKIQVLITNIQAGLDITSHPSHMFSTVPLSTTLFSLLASTTIVLAFPHDNCTCSLQPFTNNCCQQKVYHCTPTCLLVHNKMSSEVEETLKRLVSHKGKNKSFAGLVHIENKNFCSLPL